MDKDFIIFLYVADEVRPFICFVEFELYENTAQWTLEVKKDKRYEWKYFLSVLSDFSVSIVLVSESMFEYLMLF